MDLSTGIFAVSIAALGFAAVMLFLTFLSGFVIKEEKRDTRIPKVGAAAPDEEEDDVIAMPYRKMVACAAALILVGVLGIGVSVSMNHQGDLVKDVEFTLIADDWQPLVTKSSIKPAGSAAAAEPSYVVTARDDQDGDERVEVPADKVEVRIVPDEEDESLTLHTSGAKTFPEGSAAHQLGGQTAEEAAANETWTLSIHQGTADTAGISADEVAIPQDGVDL